MSDGFAVEIVLHMAEVARAHAAVTLTARGYVDPSAFVFGRRNPDSGAPEAVIVATKPVNAECYGDPFANEIREIVRLGDATAVLFVSEVWMSMPAHLQGVSREEFFRAAKNLTPASEDPDRSEAILVTVEHKDLPSLAVWVAKISRDAEGKPLAPSFEQWSDGRSEDKAMEGRFARFLPQRDLRYS